MKCKSCQKEMSNPSYCSRSCAVRETNKVPKRILTRKCVKCDQVVRNHRSSLCQIHYEEALTHKKSYVENLELFHYYGKDSLKNLHASSKSVHIRALARSWFKELTKFPCSQCGYDKHVELCHIKAISSFPSTAKIKEVNCKENLIQLCPNCHWELDNLVPQLVAKPEPTT